MRVPASALERGSCEPPARYPPAPARAGPAALFALLLITVLAMGMAVFGNIWTAVIAGDRIAVAGQACDAAEGLPADDVTSVTQPQVVKAAHERAIACASRLLIQQASVALVTGFGALLGLTLALYWLYPTWTIRRHRLEPLSPQDDPALWTYLNEMCTTARLRSPPGFLLDPFADTTTGRAFGHLGQRWVCLDAGLVTWFTTDRRRFRAVVLHELAHLHNRDVDPTYLTIALWKAFGVLVVTPAAVVLAVPTLFSFYVPPRSVQLSDIVTVNPGERARTAAGLLVLTALMYLVRAAVLRSRELNADARAAAWDGPDGALGSIVEKLSVHRPAGWRSWLSSHPTPRQRRDAIRAPEAGFPIRVWHLLVAGIAAAMTSVTVLHVIPLQSIGGTALVSTMAGLIGAVWLGGALTVGVWQAVAAAAEPGCRTGTLRVWLAVSRVPALLTVGFLIGDLASFVASVSGHAPLLLAVLTGDRMALLAVGLLAVGGLLVAAWSASTARTRLAQEAEDGPQARPRNAGAPATAIVVGILVVAPWLAAWIGAAYAIPPALAKLWFLDERYSGPGPYLHAPLGWYTTVAHWTQIEYAPLAVLVDKNPLVMIGVVLPWLGPLLITRRPRRPSRPVDRQGPPLTGSEAPSGGSNASVAAHRYPLKVALLAAVAGGVFSVVLVLVAMAVARATVPPTIRAGHPFLMAIGAGIKPATVLVGGVLAAVVVAVLAPRHRPVLVPLTVFAAVLLAELAADLLAVPFAILVNLFVAAPRPAPTPTLPSLTGLVAPLTAGTVLAVPTALVAAAMRAALPHRYRLPRFSASPEPVRTPWSLRLVLGGLVAVACAVTIAQAATVLQGWADPVASERPDADAPPTWAATDGAALDPCVTGVWHETSRRSWLTLVNVGMLEVDSSQTLHTFSAEGRVTTAFVGTEGIGVHASGRGLVTSADDQAVVDFGHRIELTTSGSVWRTYRTASGYLLYAEPRASATTTVAVDGRPMTDPALPILSSVERYTCIDNTMVLSSSWYVAQLERIS
ncbi:M48 family metalloprotease [Micromonospora sp. WMMD730]|uniref:M48 family metalloprotease n=1 Tax=Micromonospora sp. WMMD730 TaxID=3404128 RepID=UPI003B93A124